MIKDNNLRLVKRAYRRGRINLNQLKTMEILIASHINSLIKRSDYNEISNLEFRMNSIESKIFSTYKLISFLGIMFVVIVSVGIVFYVSNS